MMGQERLLEDKEEAMTVFLHHRCLKLYIDTKLIDERA